MSLVQSQYSPWGCLQCRCNLSGSSASLPVVHPASKAEMNHLLRFRRCRRSKLQTGIARKAQSGTNVWTIQPRTVPESCCFITETPTSAARPAFSERRQRKTAWVRNHFKHLQVNRPSPQNQSLRVQVPPPELSVLKGWLLVCTRVLTLLSLHQHRIYSHTTYPIP